MGVYDRFVALARRIVLAKGAPCVWAQSAPTIDPATPWIGTSPAPTDYPCNIAFIQRKDGSLFAALGGTDIPVGDEFGVMCLPTVEFEPNLTGVVTRTADGKIYRPKKITRVSPNGEKIAYKIEFHA